MKTAIQWARAQFPEAEGATAEPALHFGDPMGEHRALRDRAALLPAGGWAPILIEGDDAADYLHRRLTKAVTPIVRGRGVHALLLGGDGRLQAALLLYRGNDAFFALADPTNVAATADQLERYVINDNVELARQWGHEASFALAGPDVPAILRSLIDAPVPDLPIYLPGYASLFTTTIGGLPARLFRDARFPIPYVHVTSPVMGLAALLRLLHDACRSIGGRLAGELAGEMLRVEAGVGRWGRELDEQTFPLDAGLREAIDTDKGCYPGQEVLARTINLGHPARRLVRLTAAGEVEIPAGAPVRSGGRDAGRVTTAVTWPGLGSTEMLASLAWAERQASGVEVMGEAGPVPATVMPLEGRHE